MRAAVAGACLGLALASAPAIAATPDWRAAGGGEERRHVAAQSPLAPVTAPRVRRAWVAPLDGAVAGSPIVLGAERLAIVGTSAGSLYALDLATGAVRWRRQLAARDVAACHALRRPGVEAGSYGVSATPVLDPATRVVYAADGAGRVFALDGATGADVPGWPRQALPEGAAEHPWGGLALGAGALYLTTGGICPAQPGPARVLRLGTAGGDVLAFDPAPAADSGPTAWGATGVTVDPATGQVWAATGPGARAPFAGRIVRLTADLRPRARTAAPPARDRGYASAPVLLQPPGCPPLVTAVARAGRLDLFRRDRLGASPVARADLRIEAAGTPTWDAASRRLLVHTYTGLRAFRFARGCRVREAWRRTDGGSAAAVVVSRGVGVAAVRDLRLVRLRDGRRLARLPFARADRGVALAAPAVSGEWIVAATSGGYAYGFRVPRSP